MERTGPLIDGLTLPPLGSVGTVTFVLAFEDAIASTLAAAAGLLSDDERARRDRFVFDRHRHRFAATRAMLKIILGHYVGVMPTELRFVYGRHGKPSLDRCVNLSFNVSHCDGCAAITVSKAVQVGVDVEAISEARNHVASLAHTYFGRQEAHELEQLDGAVRQRRFIELWTLKEAYLKALGCGLSRDLDEICFSFRGETDLVGNDRSAGLRDVGIALFDVSTGYRLAIAAGLGGGVAHPATGHVVIMGESPMTVRLLREGRISASSRLCGDTADQ